MALRPITLDELLNNPDAQLTSGELAARDIVRPVPDGVYVATLVLDPGRDNPVEQKRDRKTGAKFSVVHVVASIIRPAPNQVLDEVQPRPEGRSLRAAIPSRPFRWDGQRLSGVSRVLRALKIPTEHLRSSQARIEALVAALSKPAVVKIQTQWQAYSWRERRVVLYGMRNFPKDVEGKVTSLIVRNGERVAARAAIIRYSALTSEEVL